MSPGQKEISRGPIGAEPGIATDYVVGKNLTLRSGILGEDRPLQIFTPIDYESAASSYPTLPVLYLLDGADNYMHVTGAVDYLARKNRIPPMIIVAVGNTDRTRDLTPTHTLLGLNGRRWDTFESSGGADRFFEFLRHELMPFVENNYRTAPFRILDGHSFGGLFALKIMLENPDSFQAYLAISPSLWWDNQVMLKNSGPIGRAGQFLFLSVGNEGGLHQASIEGFVKQLKERAAPGFRWDFMAYPGETHNSMPHLNLYDALKFFFADWDFMALAYDDVRVSYEDGVKHCAALSEKFGFTVVLPESRIVAIANRLLFQGRIDDGIQVFEQGIRSHPNSATCYAGLGGALAEKGSREAAIENYQNALAIDPNSELAKRGLERLMR